MSDDEKDDNAQSRRPNQKYNLSRNGEEVPADGLVFYYSRERRLKNAPESVQNMYKEEKKSRFGLFSVLVADRPRRLLFVMIILLCAIILILSVTGFLDPHHTFDGNRLEISGTNFEGAAIILIKKNVRFPNAYSGAVDIAVSVPVESASHESFSPDSPDKTDQIQVPVFYHRIFFSMEKEEVYRFSVPFDSPELLMVLQSEKNTLQFKLLPK